MTADYPVDLHTHTLLSDGTDSVRDLILKASAAGIQVLAITDHDVLPPREIQLNGGGSHNILHWAKGKGLCLLQGIEISCESGLEDVHIIGFGCDWNKEEIVMLTKEISQGKAKAYQELIKRLNQRGYKLTLEEVLNFQGSTVDIYELQKKRIFDCIAAKGYTDSWVKAKLLVRDDEYLNVKREKPSAKHAIEVIHRNGGIAVLAHPYLIDPVVTIHGKKLKRWDYIKLLMDYGIDGIEVKYPYEKTTCKDRRPSKIIWEEVKDQIPDNLIVSAGSDYHGDKQINRKDVRQLGECGLTMHEFLSAPQFAKLYHRVMNL